MWSQQKKRLLKGYTPLFTFTGLEDHQVSTWAWINHKHKTEASQCQVA